MKPLPTLLLTIAAALVATALYSQPQPQADAHPVFAPLKAGTPVSLKAVPGGYQIVWLSTTPNVLTHRVVETGPDFIVVEDASGVTETRIPIHSVVAVKVLTLGDPR
ncbi:MAG: hypothetical protein N2C14_25245 [Planctomycetales bacterium]